MSPDCECLNNEDYQFCSVTVELINVTIRAKIIQANLLIKEIFADLQALFAYIAKDAKIKHNG